MTASSVSVPMKTPKIKSEVIHPKDGEGDTFYVKTTLSQQIFPKGLNKILLGIPILNLLERADRENIYFYSPLVCSF